MGEVHIGLPGPWAENCREKADHYTTKIGGLPDWPIPEPNIKRELLYCRVCDGRLCLVAQVYAPILSTKLNIEERAIYIFGCPNQDCGKNPDSWRAIRLQKGDQDSEPNLALSNTLPSEKESFPMDGASNWLKDTLLMNDSGKLNDGSVGDKKLDDLARAFSEASALSSCSKKQNRKKRNNSSTRARVGRTTAEETPVPVLPCFYIYFQTNQAHGSIDAVSSFYSSLTLKEDAYAATDTDEEEKWVGETYEYDKALGADTTYLKFKKQMDTYPEQCLRYSYGGIPLLATSNSMEPDKCIHCGSPLVYELQLFSPILYFLQQAANASVACSADGWSWITLIVYTCSRSCFKSKGKLLNPSWEIAEEFITVQGD
ncbi:programmed cell death protein 2-like [Zingiber officinale]|uniref:programmed cell death protein 2-like n=1 Tax=Zingiber officinale TaxID=94328 RepID=UPI001C4D7F3B|nr:programmed cell death protein 2-like [Zingiber officinale]XP_042374100.1 programmed cell death protein 2-like [Zingiber officinale]